MADITTMKLITLEKLALYHDNITSYIDAADAKSIKTVAIDGNVLKFYKVEEPVGETAPAYEIELPEADLSNLLEKFEAATAGHVVTVAEDGKTIADSGVALADLATKEEVEAVDTKAEENAQAIADLDAKVGEIPVVEGQETPATVIEYINKKTEGIATDAALGELQEAVNELSQDVKEISDDYLKAADKQELADAIAEEARTARAAEEANAAAIKAISDDYLKASDKEELQGNIDEVAEVANAAATKTALQEEVARATGIEAGLRTDIDAVKADYLKAADKTELANAITAEKERAEAAEESLQTQINTIMNNPDTEGVINSINEFTQYIADHGEIAEGFRTDIDANAKAIEDLETLAAETYETKEDATAKYDEVMAEVAAKAVQADWNQNDETAADYIKNRPFYEADANKILFDDDITLTTVNEEASYRHNLSLTEGVDYNVQINDVSFVIKCGFDGIDLSQPYFDTIGSNICLTENGFSIKYYNTTAFHLKISTINETILKQLDEKFIPDTIVRVADMEVVAGKVSTLEGEMDAVEAAVATKVDQTAYDTKVQELVDADADQVERIEALEAKFTGDESVDNKIADALEDAAQDAADKDTALKTELEKYTDDAVALDRDRIAELEADTHTHANADELAKIADGSVAAWNAASEKAHEHKNLELLETYTQTETDLADAVAKKHAHENADVLEGIDADKVAAWDAAETNAEAYAKEYADGLNTAMNTRVEATEEATADHKERLEALESVKYEEVTEAEINALFNKAE